MKRKNSRAAAAPESPRAESESPETSTADTTPQEMSRLRRLFLGFGRLATFAVMAPPRTGLEFWSRLRPPQQLVLGFASYVIIGTALLSISPAQERHVGLIDNLFNATSAVSTTGLSTVSVSDSYTFFGEFVILAMFQLGGIGFMTVSSLFILARGRPISEARIGVLRAEFSLPRYFVIQQFIVHVVVFTLIVEAIGALLLWWHFSSLGLPQPLWSAVFHSVSAFATAGFSLHNSSLEAFADDTFINIVIAVLSYLGAIGFIVVEDIWYTVKLREQMITFTSRVILSMTAAIFVVGTILLMLLEPSVQSLPLGQRFMRSAFQVMTASTTAGFNTIPISPLSVSTVLIVMAAMFIGASPSGTGGGVKTTSISAMTANLVSVVRGRATVVWLAHEVPLVRVLHAAAACAFYVVHLAAGTLILSITEPQRYIAIVFEAASALGTVGLSMGITSDLTTIGKLVLVFLMFAGRCGPLTLGLALLSPGDTPSNLRRDDLAI